VNTRSHTSGGADSEDAEHVEILFPGHVDFVVLARFTAAAVAARANFDIDEIEDLRLAVDELCISAGPVSENRSLRLEFDRTRNLVKINCTFEPKAPGDGEPQGDHDEVDWKRTDDLSRLLLDALVDRHGRELANGTSSAWLEKRGNVTS
jgi:hypothetical protein